MEIRNEYESRAEQAENTSSVLSNQAFAADQSLRGDLPDKSNSSLPEGFPKVSMNLGEESGFITFGSKKDGGLKENGAHEGIACGNQYLDKSKQVKQIIDVLSNKGIVNPLVGTGPDAIDFAQLVNDCFEKVTGPLTDALLRAGNPDPKKVLVPMYDASGKPMCTPANDGYLRNSSIEFIRQDGSKFSVSMTLPGAKETNVVIARNDNMIFAMDPKSKDSWCLTQTVFGYEWRKQS